MKLKYKLDKEEQYIEDHIHEFKPVSRATLKKIKSSLKKSGRKKAITLRLNEDDIGKIKARALDEGLPYQTLISSVLHKYADNRLHETSEAHLYGRKK